MLFKPDPSKQFIEICFSHKSGNVNYPLLMSNDIKVQLATNQNNLGLILASKLDFNEHVDNKIKKCNKSIGTMNRISIIMPRKNLLTMCKSFVRHNFDYVDVIYEKTF